MIRDGFWTEVFKLQGSVTPYIAGRLIAFTLFGGCAYFFFDIFKIHNGLATAHYEYIGAVLALLLVMRTNAGYDRWYEARKLWGGIVNQSRNLAQIGLIYGPQNREWREAYARWVAAFSRSCCHSLRDEKKYDEIAQLAETVGVEETRRLSDANHMPMYVVRRVGELLKEAVEKGDLDRFYFLQAEAERARLIDHLGGCERILKTPLAAAFSIKIRRFLFLYLLFLPIAIVDAAGMLTPLIVFLVAYPLLALDQIGVELENPFSKLRLNHLPLDEISDNIRDNVLASLEDLAPLVPYARSPAIRPYNEKPRPAAISSMEDYSPIPIIPRPALES
ncbi:bestrophin family ion channel [Bremerella sp. JC817]|uniref:bestrophin family protein n=1 Tax=Bremerella sp. JC817 TaxID=3231756 RepID=UPI003459FD98